MQDVNGIVPKLVDQIAQHVRVDDGSKASTTNCLESTSSQEASRSMGALQRLRLTGSGSTPSWFAVSDLAQAAIGVAVAEVLALRQLYWNETLICPYSASTT